MAGSAGASGGDRVSRGAASGFTTIGALRLTLGVVALINAFTGAQAVLGARSFFDDYPLGRGWVASLPPYNEHLTTDVGAFYLAFAVLLGWAAVRPQRALVLPLSGAWALFSIIHIAFHTGNLGGLGTGDAIVQTIGLAAVLAPSGLAAVMSRSLPP